MECGWISLGVIFCEIVLCRGYSTNCETDAVEVGQVTFCCKSGKQKPRTAGLLDSQKFVSDRFASSGHELVHFHDVVHEPLAEPGLQSYHDHGWRALTGQATGNARTHPDVSEYLLIVLSSKKEAANFAQLFTNFELRCELYII